MDYSYFIAKAFAIINIFYAIIKILKSYIKNYNKNLFINIGEKNQGGFNNEQ